MSPTGQPASEHQSSSPLRTEAQVQSGLIVCMLCAHRFDPGGIQGNMYCPRCGRRFNPSAATEETVAIAVGPRGSAPKPPEIPTAERAESAGERFGEYDILSEVARGGMGVVYRARQRTLKRIVALKVLRGGDGASEEDLERFMREAKAAASLSHPNIVPIHELNVHKGQHFFTMDYVEGAPLDRRLEAGPLTPYQACELVEVIARTIHYAHTREIIHRDLKPANIILDTEGRPMLTDFGLAVNLTSDVRSQRMTRTGAVMGTIPYIPPEQAAGRVEQIDARSDVYSLGAVLYEILTGRPPFQGQTQFELLRRVIHQDPIPPRRLYPKIHPDVETICMKCLEKDPRRRYETAEALADDCRAFLHGEVIQARPAGTAYRIYRKALRYRAPIVLVACIVLLAGFAVALSYRASQEKEKMEHKLDRTTFQKELAEMKVAEYKEELNRTWRQEYATSFDNRFRATTNRSDRYHPWYHPKHVKHLRKEARLHIQGTPRKQPDQALFGIHLPVPLDFKLTANVRVPEENPGILLLLVNTDADFRLSESTEVVRLGVPGNPGAKITKGEATLAEAPTFEIEAVPPDAWDADGGWQKVVLSREEGVLRLWVDKAAPVEDDEAETAATEETEAPEAVAGAGAPLLQNEEHDIVSESETLHLALGAKGGTVQIRKLDLSVMGLSQPMIRSLLELAGSLNIHSEHKLARMLYERVVIENTEFHVHIKALRGCARSLAAANRHRKDVQKRLPAECKALAEKIDKRRSLEKGEQEFLLGLAFARLPHAPFKKKAMDYFAQATQAAQPDPADFVQPDRCLSIGPFPAPDGFATRTVLEQEAFNAEAVYEGMHGQVRWTPVAQASAPRASAAFPQKGHRNAEAIFYVRRLFHCKRELPVTLRVGSDDGCVVWVNGEELLRRDVERGLAPGSDLIKTTFLPGENAVLLKIHNRKGASGFSLEAVPDLTNEPVGPCGLLARLETALVYLRLREVENAARHLLAMQEDGTLERLAGTYPQAVRVSGTLASGLETADEFLRAKQLQKPEACRQLLESLETLFPNAGKELALRYHRLAKRHMAQKAWEPAGALLATASKLAPDWYLPRFDLATIFFETEQEKEGHRALAQASQAVSESFELQVHIAGFYLDNPREELRSPGLAHQAAQRAVDLSNEKNPLAWDLCARALFMSEAYTEALAAVQHAIELERTPEREELLHRIEEAVDRSQEAPDPEETVPGPFPEQRFFEPN